MSKRDVLSYLLYPHVFRDYAAERKNYSDLMVVPTTAYFYGLEEGEEIFIDIEAGKRLFIRLIAISEAGEDGLRTLFFELNGQPRSIEVRDKKIAPEGKERLIAEADNPNHIGAPLSGAILSIDVQEGNTVSENDPLFTLEAMKMQSIVQSPKSATIKQVLAKAGDRVEATDLIIELS